LFKITDNMTLVAITSANSATQLQMSFNQSLIET